MRNSVLTISALLVMGLGVIPGAEAVTISLQPDSFVLFSIGLTGIAHGTGALGLGILSLTDESGAPLAADVQGSSVSVAPVPLPAAGWLLLSGLGTVLSAFSPQLSNVVRRMR